MRLKSTILVLTILLLSSCGETPNSDTPEGTTPVSVNDDKIAELNEKINKLNDKVTQLETQKSSEASIETNQKSPSTRTAKEKEDEVTKKVIKSKSDEVTKKTSPKQATTTETPKATTETPKEKGRKAMDSIIATLNNASAIEAFIDKFEKSLKDGKTSTSTLKIYARKNDNMVKLEVLTSSVENSAGAKLRYTSGDRGAKVKIRPGGSLSFVTTDLPKTDSRIVSLNGYSLDDTDFNGMGKRFADPNYEGELIGASKIEGSDVYIIKITHKTQNTLDPNIKYEYIYFEPKTFNLRSWEAYDGKSQEAFFRLTLKTISFPSSIPDSRFDV
ncbi:MAG: hypothetical protein U0457_21150 [Candidatus Sericytochromatia bacterium]